MGWVLQWIVSFVLLLVLTTSQAGIPVWTFIPLTPTNLTLSRGEVVIIQYQVTNQSHRIHQLVMPPISGVVVSGTCARPLGYRQTCLLTLTIDGQKLRTPIDKGPVLCQQGNHLECYQPSFNQALHIRLSDVAAFTVGGTISGLTAAGLVLQNNGRDNLNVPANATTFQFATPIALNGAYQVTVLESPPGLTCRPINSVGTQVMTNITDVKIYCRPTQVYVANLSTSTVSQCPVNHDGSFGLCMETSGNQTINSPTGIAINQLGTRVYVANAVNTVAQCLIDKNGFLGACISAIINTNNNILFSPLGITLNKTGTIAYVAGSNPSNQVGFVFQCPINSNGWLGTCSNTNISNNFSRPIGIALNPTGTIAYVTNADRNNSTVVQCPINLDGSFGACRNASERNIFMDISGITLNSTGTIAYVANISEAGDNNIAQCPIQTNGSLGICVNTNASNNFDTIFSIVLNSVGTLAYVSVSGANTVLQCPIKLDGSFDLCIDAGGINTFNRPLGIILN